MTLTLPAGAFFGETTQRREVAGFRFSEARYPPSLKIPRHSHACANFCFVINGSYAEVYEGGSRTCLPTTLVFHPLGEVHSDRPEPTDVNIFCVEVDQDRLDGVREHSVVLDTPNDFWGGPEARLGAQLYREFRHGDAVAALALEGLTLELMARASRRVLPPCDRQPPRWLVRARDLLRSQYATSLTQSGIAQAVGVHPVHLAREFKHHYQCTAADYVRSLRVEDACYRLTHTHEPLGEIALFVGFADQSHFTRTFRRITGLTPSEYRSRSKSR